MLTAKMAGIKEILNLALPIILSMASYTLIGFVDTWMVAQVGTEEIAAAMPAGIIAYTLTAFPLGITQCVSTFASQSLGRRSPGEGSIVAWQGLYMSIAIGLFVFVLWPFAPYFFWSFKHEPSIVLLETTYFRIRLFGILFSVAVGTLNGFFYGMHRPRVPLLAMVTANCVNVILAYAMIFGEFGCPRLGLAGAAWAMVLSFAIQFAVLFLFFLSAPYAIAFETRTSWKPCWPSCVRLLRVGWAAGFQMFMDVLGWGLLIIMMVGQFGKEHLAASNITIQYMTLSFMPALVLGQALTAIVGKYIGEGKPDVAKARAREAFLLTILYMALIAGCIFLFRSSLARVFTADPAVVGIASNLMMCAILLQLFDGTGIVFAGALRGAGDTRWIAGLTTVLILCVFTPLSVGSVLFTGLESLGPWIAGTVNVCLFSAGVWWRFSSGAWKRIDIFSVQKERTSDDTHRHGRGTPTNV